MNVDNTYDIVYGNHNLLKIDNSEYVKQFPDLITISYLLIDTVPHLGTRIRKSLFDDNFYDESLNISSDWTWYFDALINKISFYHCNFVTVNFRLDGVSSINHNLGMEERVIHLQRKHPDYVLILSKYLEKEIEIKSILRPEIVATPIALSWGNPMTLNVKTNQPILTYEWDFADTDKRTIQSDTITHLYKKT